MNLSSDMSRKVDNSYCACVTIGGAKRSRCIKLLSSEKFFRKTRKKCLTR